MVILGGWVFSYERGTPVAVRVLTCDAPRRQSVRDPLLLYIVTNCLLKKASTRLTVKDVALNLQQVHGCPRLAL